MGEIRNPTIELDNGLEGLRKLFLGMKYFLLSISFLILVTACSPQGRIQEIIKEPPTPLPHGILIQEIPANMDIIFDSIRHVLNDLACLDTNFEVDSNFINLPGCNALIYDSQDGTLAARRQLFAMDLETGEVVQITNTDCAFTLGQAVDSTTLMTLAMCSDTDNNGKINEKDKPEIYLLDLPSGKLNCLTCEYDLTSINNPDYSHVNQSVVFSAQHVTAFHNYLFSIDTHKNLTQLTDQDNYMDFDCSWSEDGTKIVFSRLPDPWFTIPSQVWLMNADGTNQEKITNGGSNPNNEGNFGPYSIGIDADPDLNPDNKKIVFSRLKTGLENVPFGIYELIVLDIDTKEMEILDSQYANMIPQWKIGGILINRQVGAANSSMMSAMDMKQSLYLYKDGKFEELEKYPYDIFPMGAYGGYWIER
jgi:Tol biopolymer transport system component